MEETVNPTEGEIESGAAHDAEGQALDDATFEPHAHVEQGGDYQQAEAIQKTLADQADGSDRADVPVNPVKPVGDAQELPLPCPPGDLPEGSGKLDEGGGTYSPNPGVPKDGGGWLSEVPEDVQIRDGGSATLPPTEAAAPATDVVYKEAPDLGEGQEPRTQAQMYGGEPDTLVPGAYPGEGQEVLAPRDDDLVRAEVRGDLSEATLNTSGGNQDETIDPSQLEYEPGHPPEPPDLSHDPPKENQVVEEDKSVLGKMPKMREDLSDLEPAGSGEGDEQD